MANPGGTSKTFKLFSFNLNVFITGEGSAFSKSEIKIIFIIILPLVAKNHLVSIL